MSGQILEKQKIPKKENPNERKEFSGLNDFIQYIIDKDEEKITKDEKIGPHKKLEKSYDFYFPLGCLFPIIVIIALVSYLTEQ